MGLFNRRKKQIPEWASFFKSHAQFEKFEAAIRAEFTRRGLAHRVEDGWVLLGDVGKTRDMRCGLSNIGATCAQHPERDWPELMREHFDRVLARLGEDPAASAPKTWAEAAPLICIRLFEPDHVADFPEGMAWREDVSPLRSFLMIDQGDSIRMLRVDELEAWGVDADTAFGRAVNNLRTLAPIERHEVAPEQAPGVFLIHSESMWGASWLLEPEAVLPDDRGAGVMVSVPTRHTMLAYAPEKESFGTGLRAMLMLTRHHFDDEPGAVSPRLFWRYEGRTVELPYDLEDDAVNFRPPQEFSDVMSKFLE